MAILKISAATTRISREVIKEGYDAILDQSDEQNLYNHLSNYTKLDIFNNYSIIPRLR